MNRSALSLLLALPLFAVACAHETAGAADETDSADAELSSSRVTELSINLSAGFMAPSPLNSCLFHHSGRYVVNLVAKTVKGEGCAAGAKNVGVDRKLTAAELTSIKTALRGVKQVRNPDACIMDGPGLFLSVKKGASETNYIDPANACGGGSKAATGLDGLFAAAEKLTTVTAHTLEGELASVMAIGGETTGTVIQTESGTFEVQFPDDGPLAGQFVEGRKALVVGPMVEKQGVEIARRTILEVKDALVCPASSAVINCMPPNESKVCDFGNRLWVQNNCGGVTFID
jgi:hypothetical protein